MTKKEALSIVIAEAKNNLYGFENDPTYDELREAIKKLTYHKHKWVRNSIVYDFMCECGERTKTPRLFEEKEQARC